MDASKPFVGKLLAEGSRKPSVGGSARISRRLRRQSQYGTFALMVVPKFILRGVLAALLVPGLASAAAAQQADNWLTRLFQPPAASSVPRSTGTSPNDASGWSGQPGASGNPLMTADVIRAAAADFANCIERIWPDAERRGISRQT